MQNNFVLDTTGFDAAISAFQKAKEAYDAARELIEEGTDTLEDAWKGEGGGKYESTSKKIRMMLADDGESLQFVIDNLVEIRARYAETDTQIASKIDSAEI